MCGRVCIVIIIWLLGLNTQLKAQICQGSLGDPIINITFGSGANPGPSMPAATTNYQYVTTSCPNDGQYTLTNYTSKCFDSTWYTVEDHTTDDNGYFMLVNASFDPGQFYLDTVKGLCAGSTYEFAAWLVNVKKPVLCWGATTIINPNITFTIESTNGSVLQSYNTGEVIAGNTSAEWRQYGFFFTTPAGITDVVVRMVNNAPGGCGNDLGLDDITFRPCGPKVTSYIEGSTRIEDSICQGTNRTYNLKAEVSPGYNNPSFQWQSQAADSSWNDITGANALTLNVGIDSSFSPGVYNYRLVVAEYGNLASTTCRVASQQIKLIVVPGPIADYGISGTNFNCANNTITFYDSSTIAVGTITKWTWDAGDNTAPVTNPNNEPFKHVFANPGHYSVKLTVESSNGCTASKVKPVEIDSAAKIDFTYSTVCQNNFTFFNPTLTFDSTADVEYHWDFGDPESGSANISDIKTASHIFTQLKPYTVTLTASTNAGCSATVSKTIPVVHPQPQASFVADSTTICQGGNIRFTSTSNGEGSTVASQFWSFGDGNASSEVNPSHTYAASGNLIASLYVVNSLGCVSNTYTDTITVNAKPKLDAGLDVHVIAGASATLQPKVSPDASSFVWQPSTFLSDANAQSPVCTPQQDILYRLTVTNANGCEASDELMVRILQNIVVPNAFSPNNDGVNDKWEIQNLKDYPLNKIRIFNRQGVMVYEAYNYAAPWDGTVNGKPMPVGVYYYVVEPGQGIKPLTGSLTLLR